MPKATSVLVHRDIADAGRFSGGLSAIILRLPGSNQMLCILATNGTRDTAMILSRTWLERV